MMRSSCPRSGRRVESLLVMQREDHLSMRKPALKPADEWQSYGELQTFVLKVALASVAGALAVVLLF